MMADSISDLNRVAILSMDLQTVIVSLYAKNQPEYLPRVAGALGEARGRACA